jgi:hypothetical protein
MIGKLRPLIWLGFLLILLADIGGMIFLWLVYSTAAPLELVNDTIYILNSIILAAVAMPICLRQPHNSIGWLVLLAAFFLGLQSMSQYYTAFSWLYYSGRLPGTMPFTWLAQWTWLPPYTFFMFLMLLFPTGRVLSTPWRWVGIAVIINTMLLLILVASSSPMTVGLPGIDLLIPNPVGLWELPKERWEFLFTYFWLPLLLLILLSAASIAVRWRRANGGERQQIKVVVYAVTVIVIVLTAGTLIESLWYDLIIDGSFLLFPLAFAVAILRYRLYDIDLVIHKTLVYSLVTGLLALIYFSSVLLLQRIFTRYTGQESDVAIVLSTLLIAALFTPLRRRIQKTIDRRFFRQRYDTQKVLHRFADTARNEVELEQLSSQLLIVISETVQPASVGLWLRHNQK